MSFKERIAEARRDKAGRKSEQAKERKKALAKKKNRLTSLGLVNKNPLSEDENPLSLGDGNPSTTVDEDKNELLFYTSKSRPGCAHKAISFQSPPPHGKKNYYVTPPIENASLTF